MHVDMLSHAKGLPDLIFLTSPLTFHIIAYGRKKSEMFSVVRQV